MGRADFADRLRAGCSACRWALLATMEDVVFVSERAVGKRKRQDDDDDAERKRVQVKEESSSDGSSFSSSESDDDSDDEPNGMVEHAMSAIRISTEPQAKPSSSNPAADSKSKNQTRTPHIQVPLGLRLSRTAKRKSVINTYIGELEGALKDGLSEKQFNDLHLRPPQGYDKCRGYVGVLEIAVWRRLPVENPARRALEGFVFLQDMSGYWKIDELHPRIARFKSRRNEASHLPKTQEQAARSSADGSHPATLPTSTTETAKENVVAKPDAQGEIDALKAEVGEQKRLRREKVKIYKQRIQDLHATQRDMASMIQQRDSEIQQHVADIALLKLNSSDRTTRSESAAIKKAEKVAKEASKAAKGAEEAAKTAQANTKAMFEHYDSVQNKNTVLIGKMRMMAKAGGFDGPNTSFRKELDALKAPELTELDEYEEQE
jgi:hypothetical protein